MNSRRLLTPGLICLCSAMLAACAGAASKGAVRDGPPIAETLAAAATPRPLPPEVAAALLPPMEPAHTLPASTEPRFDLVVDNVPARPFFMSLVTDSPYNMVVAPDIAGTITLQLRNVTLPEVMEVTREVFGYEYRRQGNIFLVQAPGLRTQVFEVDYLNLIRTGTSRTRVSSGQSTESRNVDPLQQAAGLGAPVADTQLKEQSYGTNIETESEAAFWSGLEASVSALIGTEDGRNVVVNPHSGAVVVRALPVELREVGRFLGSVGSIAQRQVILEAKVIEVELRDGFQAGIDWVQLRETANSRALIGQHRPSAPGRDPIRLLDVIDEDGSYLPFNPEGGLGANPFGGVFSAALLYKDFAAFVELLESQGRTRVLSSPRVATVNNQKAVIKVGSDEFFVTGVTSQTTTGGAAASTNRNIILTPFFSGIALDVTPQISAAGDVILHIHPTVSEVVDQTKTFTVGGLSESLPLAFSTVRETDSIVRTRSGETVVIGGLMRDSASNDRSQVPWVGRIPGLGSLFRHSQQRIRKSELVILLRTTVVDTGQAWQDEAEAAGARIRKMEASQSWN